MTPHERIEQQRAETVRRMLAIGPARKGTINEQYVAVFKDGQPTGAQRGPYWVLTTKKGGKTLSLRLKTPQEVARVRQEVANHQELTRLWHVFEELTEQLGAVQTQAAASEEALKKGLRSRSNKARKSRG